MLNKHIFGKWEKTNVGRNVFIPEKDEHQVCCLLYISGSFSAGRVGGHSHTHTQRRTSVSAAFELYHYLCFEAPSNICSQLYHNYKRAKMKTTLKESYIKKRKNK